MTAERECGTCSLCCKLLPVVTLRKGANTRCEHQRRTGCKIYDQRPNECRLWLCAWLGGGEALDRPDRGGYVVDTVPDFVTSVSPDGERMKIPVIQVWVDPKRPTAHEAPGLRHFLNEIARQHGFAALIRFNERDGFVLVPPALTGAGWSTMDSKRDPKGTNHGAAEVRDAIVNWTSAMSDLETKQ